MKHGAFPGRKVDSAEYLAAMAHHVTSVCVVTTELDGKRYGLTATAVSSVSADPPRLLICINKTGTTHDRIVEAGTFCVNVLAEGQERVAMAFAGMGAPGADRFETGTWTVLNTGAPVLEGAAAAFDCVVGEAGDHGSHTVFFGDVVATAHLPGQDALLYGGRRFRQLRKIFEKRDGPQEYL